MNLGSETEYKYVIQNSTTMKVQKWEGSGNRKVSIPEIEAYLDRLGAGSIMGSQNEFRFNYKGINMVYTKNKEILELIDIWRN